MLSDYLRRQAETCLRIARAGFDLATAERLGRLAAELREKADELDEQEREAPDAPHPPGQRLQPRQRFVPQRVRERFRLTRPPENSDTMTGERAGAATCITLPEC